MGRGSSKGGSSALSPGEKQFLANGIYRMTSKQVDSFVKRKQREMAKAEKTLKAKGKSDVGYKYYKDLYETFKQQLAFVDKVRKAMDK